MTSSFAFKFVTSAADMMTQMRERHAHVFHSSDPVETYSQGKDRKKHYNSWGKKVFRLPIFLSFFDIVSNYFGNSAFFLPWGLKKKKNVQLKVVKNIYPKLLIKILATNQDNNRIVLVIKQSINKIIKFKNPKLVFFFFFWSRLIQPSFFGLHIRGFP